MGTDESAFNAILATRSWAHLRQLMAEYQTMRGHSLEQAVAREFSANAEKGLLAICKAFYFVLNLLFTVSLVLIQFIFNQCNALVIEQSFSRKDFIFA